MSCSVPDLCDDFLEELQVLDPLFNNYGGKEKFCGEIVTVRCFEDNTKVKAILATQGKGKVLVVDGSASMRCALLGDLLAGMGSDNGWQGVLINGCVRDVEVLRSIDLGILALNRHPARSKKRGDGEVGLPVRFASVSFRPGQMLYADANGTVIADRDLGTAFV